MMRQSQRTKLGRRSRIEVVLGVDVVVEVPEGGEASEEDVAEVAAGGFKANCRRLGHDAVQTGFLYSPDAMLDPKVNWIFALGRALVHGWMTVGLLALWI